MCQALLEAFAANGWLTDIKVELVCNTQKITKQEILARETILQCKATARQIVFVRSHLTALGGASKHNLFSPSLYKGLRK